MGNKKVKIFNNLENLLLKDTSLLTPLVIARGKVLEDWIDYNCHMNMAYYVQCFEESSDFLLEMVNLGYNYAIENQKGVFVINCEINYKKEIQLDQLFYIYLNAIECKGKKLTVDLVMNDKNNNLVAGYQIVNLNVDLITKKSISFDQQIIEKLS